MCIVGLKDWLQHSIETSSVQPIEQLASIDIQVETDVSELPSPQPQSSVAKVGRNSLISEVEDFLKSARESVDETEVHIDQTESRVLVAEVDVAMRQTSEHAESMIDETESRVQAAEDASKEKVRSTESTGAERGVASTLPEKSDGAAEDTADLLPPQQELELDTGRRKPCCGCCVVS